MHIPVLFDEVMAALKPAALQPSEGKRFLDATLGGAGHTSGLLRAGAQVLSTDADASAIEAAREKLAEFGERSQVRQCWLDETPALAQQLGFVPLDGVLIDLGLSSNQLDTAERGFAFMREGPLDMRFDQARGQSAAELINGLDVDGLMMILREYGEVQNARRVAEAMWAARPIQTTSQLKDVVAGVARADRKTRVHPATMVFQALRIAVNDELRRLSDALPKLIDLLRPGGRIALITFHSLEDRIVKNAFRDEAREVRAQPGFGLEQLERAARLRLITKEPIVAGEAELAANPRARSAKLRTAERV
ncbi:MAG: 16S rRNA (cytosine(1402)-N(4))-methyltransferase RsmH [Anaerolineae bacterium]|nr:16S rRNA (cytosine(1402)-N(4))-methyltransferase RsmH [Anaerolineae bacterium]